jgi:5-(carboxyamino)imidazole ribonucleotide mutase
MPKGIPVGTLAIGTSGARNAALLAAAIVCRAHPQHRAALAKFRDDQTNAVLDDPDPRVEP